MGPLSFGDKRLPSAVWARTTVSDDGCWIVSGADNGDGYIRVTIGGKRMYLHHLVSVIEQGPIPGGMVRDHSCHDPKTCAGGQRCIHRRCLRHVAYIPASVNSSRARAASRTAETTHCPKGHPYDEANTRTPPSMGGRRICHTCRMEYQRKWRARQHKNQRQEAS